jgi:hypothetical protein
LPLVMSEARNDHHLIERRREGRVNLSLPGRYALGEGREYPCTTVNVSPGGVVIRAPNTKAQIGERAVAYISEIGRVEGTIARRFGSSLVIRLETNARNREKLAGKIASCSRRRSGSTMADRPHECIQASHRPATLSTPRDFLDVEAIVRRMIWQGYALRNEREGVMSFLTKLSDEGLLRKSSPDR